MALFPFITKEMTVSRESQMLGNKWVVFAVAIIVWLAVFYFIDKSIMETQGLPVGTNLMPK